MKNQTVLTDVLTVEDLKKYLFVNLPNAKKDLFSAGNGFDRSKKFYELLGNPQNDQKTIHIAGTSGKGSTAYYLSALLLSHDFKIGTHVSPHVFDLRESVMINLKLPTNNQFMDSFKSIFPAIDEMEKTEYGLPTYFEAVIGNMFTYFKNQKVDYQIIETGLGGKFDSTNTISGPNKLSVITKIGLDHTEVLGDSLEEIANQKAGIINKKSDVMVVSQRNSVMKVFSVTAAKQNSRLQEVSPVSYAKNIRSTMNGITFDYDDGVLRLIDCKILTIAKYQVENACLAISILSKLSERDGFQINKSHLKIALQETRIPGRCELRKYENKLLILDGAHNPQKMEAFVDSLKNIKLSKKPIWLVGMKKDKDVSNIVSQILPLADKIVFTEFFRNSESKHLRNFAISADDLQEYAYAQDQSVSIAVEKDPEHALKEAIKLSEKDQLIVVSGSLYLISEINNFLT